MRLPLVLGCAAVLSGCYVGASVAIPSGAVTVVYPMVPSVPRLVQNSRVTPPAYLRWGRTTAVPQKLAVVLDSAAVFLEGHNTLDGLLARESPVRSEPAEAFTHLEAVRTLPARLAAAIGAEEVRTYTFEEAGDLSAVSLPLNGTDETADVLLPAETLHLPDGYEPDLVVIVASVEGAYVRAGTGRLEQLARYVFWLPEDHAVLHYGVVYGDVTLPLDRLRSRVDKSIQTLAEAMVELAPLPRR